MYTKPLDDNAKIIYNKRFIVLQSARMAEYGEELRSYIFQEPGLRPDCFLASGKTFGEMKKKWRIADNIVVTGLPRYDILGRAGEVYSKSDFRKRYNINLNYKIIHWSTQCHVFSREENEANFKAVFGAMKKLKDVTLVIKQHPSESEKFTEEIKRHIKVHGANAIVVPKNSDTYEQLFACDLMITRHSTTAMEAVALDKPVIILNLSGEPDQVEYVKEGVALGVYKEIDLHVALERLLSDDSDLAVRRERYIEKYLYKIDGKATERVIKIIINSLSNL
jgi:CDP-glycerol glycerophosphotransferase (TagB/SpsB family)